MVVRLFHRLAIFSYIYTHIRLRSSCSMYLCAGRSRGELPIKKRIVSLNKKNSEVRPICIPVEHQPHTASFTLLLPSLAGGVEMTWVQASFPSMNSR